MITDLFSVLFT